MSASSTDLIQTNYEQKTAPLPAQNLAKPAWGGAGLNPCAQIGSDVAGFTGNESFKDLMSEELAKDLHNREEEKVNQSFLSKFDNSEFKLGAVSDTSNDLFLAQMLQYEFDKEFDNQLQREEKHYNKNCKLAVSFDKYKVCPSWYGDDSDEEAVEVDDENRALDLFEEREWDDPVIPPCGYIRHNNKIVTKHDTNISGRKNAQRVLNFPPEINTGDAGGFDMQLSNKVYNKLMTSAVAETRRRQRVHDKEEKATAEMAMDPKTRLLIFKMVNNSILENVNGIISSGKESAVIHAIGGIYEDQPMPSECAIKVFKTYLTDFKTRERYMREDYRFKDRMSKNNNRLTIQLWAEKEFHNLRRLQKAMIPSPKPLLIKRHVLVMSFIGENQTAAPKLKHMRLPYEDWCIAYEQVAEAMVSMFQGCRLVHGDMSEYNILWHDSKCWIIDLAQAVEYTHPNAMRFLLRDCSNIIGFFRSKGLTELPSTSQLFEKITGIKLPEEEDIDRLADIEVSQALLKEKLSSSSNDHFEFVWKEIQKEESNHPFFSLDDARDSQECLDEEEEEQAYRSRPSPCTKKKGRRAAKHSPALSSGPPPLQIDGETDPSLIVENNSRGSKGKRRNKNKKGNLNV